jgi:hypothetical protein
MKPPKRKTTDGFDPQAPFVAEDGLEYEDFAHWLKGVPVHCARNQAIRIQEEVVYEGRDERWRAYVRRQYVGRDRWGTKGTFPVPQLLDYHFPPGPEAPSPAEGASGAGPGTPTPAAIHQAAEPEIP